VLWPLTGPARHSKSLALVADHGTAIAAANALPGTSAVAHRPLIQQTVPKDGTTDHHSSRARGFSGLSGSKGATDRSRLKTGNTPVQEQ
jgi:hypothetical protein